MTRRVDYLTDRTFAGLFDVNPRYPPRTRRPGPGQAAAGR